jgi:uncharacterized protein
VGKVLLIALVVALVVWLLRGAARKPRAGSQSDASVTHDLVRCARCGMHLPRADAVLVEAQTYCGPAHAQLGRQPR